MPLYESLLASDVGSGADAGEEWEGEEEVDAERCPPAMLSES